MTHSISLRIQCLIVVLVLLIHLLLLVPLMIDYRLLDTFKLEQPEPKEQKHEHLEEDTDWAELKPRAGTFADVIFYDEPAQNAFIPAPSPPEPEEAQTHPADQEDISKDNPDSTPEEILEKEELPEQPLTDEESIILHSLPVEQKEVKKTAPAQQTKKETSPPKKITLADITRGFLNQVRNDGNSTIAMAGKKGRMPTEQQIIYQRFLEKLHWQLQNSFKIHKHSLSLYESVKGVIEIRISLNPATTDQDVVLVRSSGSAIFDQFMLFIIKDARGSFPPLPKNSDPSLYSFSLVINVDIPRLLAGGSGLVFSLI